MATDDTLRTILIFLGLIILFPVIMMIVAVPLMGGHMWNGGMWGGPGPITAWLIIWGGLLLVILVGAYLVMKSTGGNNTNEDDPALEELRLAYARGELTDEEFESRRERLDRE